MRHVSRCRLSTTEPRIDTARRKPLRLVYMPCVHVASNGNCVFRRHKTDDICAPASSRVTKYRCKVLQRQCLNCRAGKGDRGGVLQCLTKVKCKTTWDKAVVSRPPKIFLSTLGMSWTTYHRHVVTIIKSAAVRHRKRVAASAIVSWFGSSQLCHNNCRAK